MPSAASYIIIALTSPANTQIRSTTITSRKSVDIPRYKDFTSQSSVNVRCTLSAVPYNTISMVPSSANSAVQCFRLPSIGCTISLLSIISCATASSAMQSYSVVQNSSQSVLQQTNENRMSAIGIATKHNFPKGPNYFNAFNNFFMRNSSLNKNRFSFRHGDIITIYIKKQHLYYFVFTTYFLLNKIKAPAFS